MLALLSVQLTSDFAYAQAFFRKYQYKHTAVCLAVDETQRIVFTFCVDSVSHLEAI